MSRTKRLALNTISTGILQVIHMLVGFIVPKVMLTTYGSEVNGLITSISQLIMYMTLIEAGVSGATVFSLYKPIADNNTTQINKILVASRNFYYKSGKLFILFILLGGFIYPVFIRTEMLNSVEIGLLFIILGSNSILEFFTLAKYRALLTADQKIYVISFANIIQVITNTVLIVILSYLRVNVVTVRAIALSSIMLRTLILWIYCKIKYSYLDFTVEPDNNSLSKRWDAMYLEILVVIQSGAPVLILTFLLSLKEVSIYSIYNIVIYGITMLLSIFRTSSYSTFGDLISRGEKSKFKNLFEHFETLFLITITIIFSITVLVYQPFIDIYTKGADISYNYPLLAVLLTFNAFLYEIKSPYSMLVTSKGLFKETKRDSTIQALLLVILSVFGGVFLGIYGIIIGMIISNLYRVIVFYYFTPKYITGYSFRSSLNKWIAALVIFVPFTVFSLISPLENNLGTLNWITYSLLIALLVVPSTLLVFYIVDREGTASIFKRFLTLIKIKRG